MKRNFTFLMAAFALMVSMMMPLGMKGQTYSRVSSVSDLVDGDQIIFVNQDETYACGTTQNTNNRTPVAISVSNHSYSYRASDNVQVFTVKVNSDGQYGFHTGSGYIYSASSSNNNLKTNTTSATTAPSGTSAWTLSASNYVFSCTNVTNTSYYLAFNGTSYFSQYKSGQSKPYIYKKQSDVSYTITFNPGNGTCGTPSVTQNSGTTITLPTATPSTECANAGWSFAGWATQSISETTTAPTLLTGSYTISGNVTLYAVYRVSDGGPASTTANMIFSSGSYSNSTITWTIPDIVSILQEQHNGQTAPNSSYVGSPRWYSGNMITITPSVTVTSISVTTTTEGYATALANSTYTNATATASDVNVTITPTNGSDAIVIVMGGQSRLSALSVSYASASYIYATAPSCSAQQQVAIPTFSPAAGTYSEAQNVTLSCTTSGATIYYTTDGSTPSTSSSVYSSAIPVSSTTTIKAIAVKSGMDNSAVASATYTINLPHTVTFNAGNGTCSQASVTEPTGTSITLPTATPSTTCADAGWTFAGWATSNVDYTTTAPDLFTGSYTINGDATLYAVYSVRSFGEAFNNSGSGDFIIFAAVGSTNHYANGTVSNKKLASTTLVSEATAYTFEKPSGYGDGEYAIKIGSDYIKYSGNSTDLGTSDQPYKWTISEAGVHGTWRVASETSGRALIFRAGTSNQFGGYATSNITGEGEYFDLEIGGEGESAYATSPDCTDITVSESSLSFFYEGGAGSFDFTVSNPISGATASASTTASWITNEAVSGNTVNFQVAANDGGARSGEITLTYAKNGTTLATATVNIHQDSNPVLPGSFENPYTVAEAVAATPSSGSSEGVYVRGIVSEIIEIEVMQYHNARYYISDDGSTDSTQLLAFYGRNINNTDFLSEDELLVGDEVVVYGQLKKYNDTPELDRGNYIVSLTRAVQPVTFNPGSCVTPNSIWVNLFTESLFDYDGTKISYTTNGDDPREAGIDFEDAWAADLELTQTTTLKAAAFVPELDKWSAVTEATYTIVPEGSGGWQGQPYTVAEALDALDENNDIKGAYVQGIVSRVTQIDTTLYYNATYYISDDGEENNELYVFRGKYISRADFTSTDQLKPGDRVTVYGDLTIYGNTNPVKEFKPKNYIENWYRPASIMITPDQFEFSSNATSGVIDVIYSSDILVNAYNPTVQFCDADGETATYDWLTVTPSQANDWGLEFILDANEGDQPRTAYLRVWGRDNQSNDIVSNIISITQSEYIVDFATLDFYFNGGHNDIAATPGLTGEYLGTYAANTTPLKFTNPNTQVSMLVLKINETPGVLTYNITGYGMVGGTFKVQESSNGITYSDLATYSGLPEEVREVTIDFLSPSTRYIRWIYVTRNKGNVGVGHIHLYKPINTHCAYAFSVNGQMGEQQSVAVGEAVQMPTSSNITFNGQTFTFRGWTTNPNNVTDLLQVGASYTMSHDATFYAVYNQPVTSTEADKHYVKVTRELSDWSGKYLIVYEDGELAFDGGLDPLDVVSNTIPVAISNGIITSTETLVAAEFTIAAVPNSNNYTIKSASGKYIGKTANGNGMDEDETTAYENSISYNEDNGEIDIVGEGGAYLRFNKTSGQNRFRYFKSATYGSQEGIQLYRYVAGVSNLYTRIFMNETAGSVTIEGPSIIPNGSVLEVTTITNTLGAARLLVDEGGQLVTSSNVNASMRKSITPYQQQEGNDNYYLVASPVNNLNPETAGMTDDDFDLYAFDQTTQGEEWRNYKAEDSDHYHFNLEVGKGYLYANNYGGFINLGGTMAAVANDVTINNVAGKTMAGWNLIGNPYPCNVTINKPFYRLAEGGAALATEATVNSVAIAPMEGVFVCAESTTETVSFTKAPNVATTGGRNLLSLMVRRNSDAKGGRVEEDNVIVRFGEGGMLPKLVLNSNLSQLYVAQNGTDYAIVNAEAEGELPVSFRAAANGNYTFSVATKEVEMNYLHLIDLKTGADVDLLQTPSYTFEANTGDFECRFKLVFALGASTSSDTFAYYNGSQWVVNASGANATLQIVDVMGRVLSSQIINGNAEVGIDRAAGVYLLRLVDGSDVKVQKIIIQ